MPYCGFFCFVENDIFFVASLWEWRSAKNIRLRGWIKLKTQMLAFIHSIVDITMQ